MLRADQCIELGLPLRWRVGIMGPAPCRVWGAWLDPGQAYTAVISNPLPGTELEVNGARSSMDNESRAQQQRPCVPN
mgnify:CR=1 FL=1